MQEHFRGLKAADPLRRSFDVFFEGFKATLVINGREVTLRRNGMWLDHLTFGDLAVCLHALEENSDLTRVRDDYKKLCTFFSWVVTTNLGKFWSWISSKGPVTIEDQQVFDVLSINPFESLREWVASFELQLKRNSISHPFTAGRESEPELIYIDLGVLVEASNCHVTSECIHLVKFCLVYWKWKLQEIQEEKKVGRERVRARFASLQF